MGGASAEAIGRASIRGAFTLLVVGRDLFTLSSLSLNLGLLVYGEHTELSSVLNRAGSVNTRMFDLC